MPPQLALIGCVSFISFLFILDFKNKKKTSVALWLPLFWLIIRASRNVSLWLNFNYVGTASDREEGNPIDRIVLLTVIVIGCLVLANRRIIWTKIIKYNYFIFIFIAYCLISILWSDFQFVSLKRWIKGFGVLVMVLIIITERNPVESTKIVIRKCAFLLVPLSILFIKYYRDLGVDFGPWGGKTLYVGVTTDKNALGRLCLVSGLYFVWNLLTICRSKQILKNKTELFINFLFIAMIFWLFKKSNSATALGCLLIGMFVYYAIGISLIKKNIKILFLLLIIISPVILLLLNSILPTIIQLTGHGSTFWGRTVLWSILLDMQTHPLLGTGYDCFWLGDRLDKLWEIYWWNPTEAHNGYLELYLELGIVGLLLWIGVIFSIFKNILRNLKFNFEFGRIQLVFLVIFLLYNITEGATKLRSLMWYVLLMITLYYPRKSANPKSNQTRQVSF